ncbi:MAG TPA: hypothetical protein VMV77_04980 [Bacteroidales bacterium]|nr:hypothetical protein [Bacteroidales bacterium]
MNDETVQKIVDSLYLTSLEFGVGILINPDLKSSWFTKSFLEEMKSKNGMNIEDEFIGAQVVPSGTIFIGSNPVTIHSESSFKIFEELLNKYIRIKYRKSEKLIRAIEIYNSSTYLNIVNHSARFILLMTSIEALIDQKKVSKRLQNSLDSYIKRINRLKINSEEKTSIVGSLGLQKKGSIKRSGKILVEYLLDNDKRYNGFLPSAFFSKAYDLRSNFVHFGKTKSKDLNIRTIQMQEFVKDMLKSYFENISC